MCCYCSLIYNACSTLSLRRHLYRRQLAVNTDRAHLGTAMVMHLQHSRNKFVYSNILP